MEDRIIWASILLAAMIVIAAWLIISKMAERRRFKERQMGRGKGQERNGLEPAE
jgi:hypothetical protein